MDTTQNHYSNLSNQREKRNTIAHASEDKDASQVLAAILTTVTVC